LNGGSQAIIVRLFHPKFASTADRDKALKAATDTAAAAAGADAAAAAAAAKTKADTFLTEPEKSAAKVVADAASQAAGVAGATVLDVKKAADAAAAKAAPINKATLTVNGLGLEAKYEGTWGNALRARIDHDVKGPDAANLFNLSVRDGMTGQIEVFRNVSVVLGHVRQVDNVLKNESRLVQMTGNLPAVKPTKHPDPDKTKTPPESDVWADNAAATNTKVADVDQATNGSQLDVNDFTGTGKEDKKEGLYALKKADLFNILCIPPHQEDGNADPTLVGAAAKYCEDRRAMLLVDPRAAWDTKDKAKNVSAVNTTSKNAALFFPRLRQPNPLHDGQVEDFVPCGAIAGIFARTDSTRGVWKAPAGLDATLVGVPQLSVPLTDAENGELNPLGVNCLRTMPAAGRIVWGSRTLQGDDRLASEWKYIPVRRTALFIEESLYRGTQWVVFEPNDEPLWAQIRLNVGAFMHNLFRQGAFQGTTPRDAYFVKCDKETTTQNDINLGIVNIVVGFAPLKPAEFVVIKLQQMAGQIQS
jgi:phage tail sheath protein FI